MLRLILLHPKAMPDDAIAQWVAFVQNDVGAAASIVTGRDDFLANAKQSGGMQGWCRSVAERFDGGVIPSSDGTVGRLTADIVEGMLTRGKPVSRVDAYGRPWRISRVTKTTGKPADGWLVS